MPTIRTWPAFLGLLLLLLVVGGLVATQLGTGGTAQASDVSHSTYRVAIDPGHGDYDPGAIGVGGVLEKDIVLEIAKLVYLKSLAYPQLEIRLTRRDDTFVSLADRIGAANRWQADVYVSIHANSYSDESVSGIETMIDNSEIWGSASHRLAESLQERLVRVSGRVDRGVKHATLYLRSAQMPAALVELGFLTNPAEADALQRLSHQTALAEAILAGIVRFLDGR